MTRMEPALLTSTRQLVLGHSQLTLMAAKTPPWVSTRSRTTTTRTSTPPLVLMRYLPTPPAPATQPSAVARSLSTRRAVVTLPWAWMLVATSPRPITSFVSVPLVTMWKIAALLAYLRRDIFEW